MPSEPPVRRPRVARAAARTAVAPLAIGLLFVGSAVFAKMVSARSDQATSALALPPLQQRSMAAPTLMSEPKLVTAAPFVARAAPVLLTATPPAPGYLARSPRLPATGLIARAPASDRFGGSALVIDLYATRASRTDGAALGQDQAGPSRADGVAIGPEQAAPDVGPRLDPTGDAIAAANAARPQAATGSGNEQFAQRVGLKQPEGSEARQLNNLDRLVPQGAIISAVMETALNSDLPGFARAVVTKDVLSFDGSVVLIPAGSRVIGEYNSGVAQGASRIFIVWSRLIRPDGVSITLGSPAVDELGRGGLSGKVNRHFLKRFGGAILLSVLTGGISALASRVGGGSTIIVNSANDANSLATQASRGNDIPPTIKTDQGALVQIFVARDLDFTAVGPARR